MFSDLILMKSFPAAIRRVREHRALGHRTVLITGALDLAIEPLRPLFDDIVAPSLAQRADGTYRGELTDVPPTGEARAQALFDYADEHGFDVAEGIAYADSTSDLPMLEAVGFPVAVNPETRLAALARKRGWLVEHFDKAAGRPAPAAADRPGVGPAPQPPRRQGRDRARRPHAAMKALVFSRKPAKFAAAMVAGRLSPGGGAKVGPARPARRRPARAARAPAGCGCARASPASAGPTSPRSTARRRAGSSRSCRSRSPPATRSSASSTTARRVVHRARAQLRRPRASRPCAPRAPTGRINHCERIGFGDLEPGLQCGFCESTGGGWSTLMVAHESQLVAVPDDLVRRGRRAGRARRLRRARRRRCVRRRPGRR